MELCRRAVFCARGGGPGLEGSPEVEIGFGGCTIGDDIGGRIEGNIPP